MNFWMVTAGVWLAGETIEVLCDRRVPDGEHIDALMPSNAAKMHLVRTTIRIDDDLYRRAKARAARAGRTVSEVIEDAVREALRPRRHGVTSPPPLPRFGGSGVMPGIDLADSAGLRDRMDEGQPLHALR